jgi:hypothetical protein
MFFAFLSLAIIGIALFVAVVFFQSRKDGTQNIIGVPLEPVVEAQTSDHPLTAQEPEKTDDSLEESAEPERAMPEEAVSDRVVGEREFIPILRVKGEIPGIKGRELVHFDGRGTLYSLESTDELDALEFTDRDLELVVDGRLLLTSRYIIIYSGESVKKFTIAAIEKFTFRNSSLVIKRKRVKTKKDVLKIADNLSDFKYILHALT